MAFRIDVATLMVLSTLSVVLADECLLVKGGCPCRYVRHLTGVSWEN